ncbi:MAG TPA: HemK/PrmC family methyltransferase [Pseudonocardiaceae bacterium]|nr:HemK/PrmC family methyltransferase [Pseudonocardiaceae bacterium]
MTATDREELLGLARQRLVAAGVWDPDGDLVALAERFLGPADPAAALAEFEVAVQERCARIPLGHITGDVAFDRLRLAVGSGVFVPRAESLAVVDWATGAGVVPEGGLVLDLCSGVGALGLAIARRRPDLRVVCVERADTAVRYLRRNVARYAVSTGPVRVHVADLCQPGCLDEYRDVDLITANPPYVQPSIKLLPEWADHQPKDAIYAGADGLDLIRVIAAHALRSLRPGGWLAVEHDRRQPEPVRQVLAAAGFTDLSTANDSAGEPRITTARASARAGASAGVEPRVDARADTGVTARADARAAERTS